MLVSRFRVGNVRSFLEPTELVLDGPLSILVGPNGGGKTNLLDILHVVLRRHFVESMGPRSEATASNAYRFALIQNDRLADIVLERHSASEASRPQEIEIELEVTDVDLTNMHRMQKDEEEIRERLRDVLAHFPWNSSSDWQLDKVLTGTRFLYRVRDGQVEADSKPANWFREYLRRFAGESYLRARAGLGDLAFPLLYLPVNRTAAAFQSNVELASYNELEAQQSTEAVSSRLPVDMVRLALGRMAERHRLLVEKDDGKARDTFRQTPAMCQLTEAMSALGYEWELQLTNHRTNRYDIQLRKEATTFSIQSSSSGERELMTYLFAIFALDVRDALILIDEPELHLHPRWQQALLKLFADLARRTNNRFVMATHSTTFIAPETVQYVSRVYSERQCSRVVRLNTSRLPNSKHLLAIINSQNNERVFFSDLVVLVEGPSDRIFFEAVLDKCGREAQRGRVIEVVDVGGKNVFPAYEQMLSAAQVSFVLVADRDYVQQVGTPELKKLFKDDAKAIKRSLDDPLSRDADALVAAIEGAIGTGDWGQASATWEYLKARRRRPAPILAAAEQLAFDAFVQEKAEEGIYILRHGALEDYLPEQLAKKDIEQLIAFLREPNFMEMLRPERSKEAESIARAILAR